MMTKGFSIASLLSLATATPDLRGARRLAGGGQSVPFLPPPDDATFGFLVSQIQDNPKWCLTAVEGTEVFGNLGFRPCDFSSEPENQLWSLDSDGQLHSSLNYNLCFVVGFGTNIKEGIRGRLGPCSTAEEYSEFVWDAGATDQVQVKAFPSFCATNRGPNPNFSDTIHLKGCQTSRDYKWTFQPLDVQPAPPPDLPKQYLISQGDGCMVPQGGLTAEGTPIILGLCETASAWTVIENGDTSISLATTLADNVCLQIGFDALMIENWQSGTRIRLGNCEDVPAQQFLWPDLDGAISPTANTTFGLEYLGPVQEPGESIVLKEQSLLVGSWTAVVV